MRCGTLQFGCSLVQCGSRSVDRVVGVYTQGTIIMIMASILILRCGHERQIVQILANSGFLFKLCGRHPTV